MFSRIDRCQKYRHIYLLRIAIVTLGTTVALESELHAQVRSLDAKAHSPPEVAAALKSNGRQEFQVSFSGELVPAIVASQRSIIEYFYPMSVALADQLTLNQISESLNLSQSQITEVTRIRKGLGLAAETMEEFSRQGHLTLSQKQTVAEADERTIDEIVDILNPRQLKELNRLSALRDLRLFGMANWLNSRVEQRELSRLFRLWLQAMQPEIQARFQECRKECLQSLSEIPETGQGDSLSEFVNTEWITNDPWLFGVQLRSDMESRKLKSLSDFLEVGNPNYHPSLHGEMEIRILELGSPRILFEQLITHRAYGGIEAMDDQITEIRSQLFYMPPGEEEKLQARLAELGKRAVTSATEEVQTELREINMEIEGDAIGRLEQILVPVQIEMVREILLRRLVNVYGPWLVLARLESQEITMDEKLRSKFQDSRDHSLKCYEKFEEELFNDLWNRAKIEFPEIVEQLDSVGIAKPGLKPGDGIWLFRNVGDN